MPRRSRNLLSSCLLLPDIESLGSDRAIGIGCQSVSARMEVAMDECVSGEKVLSLLGRFEPLHLALSAPCRSM